MLKDSKVLLPLFSFLSIFLEMVDKAVLKTDTCIGTCCHEMPPVFEMHFPTSRGSNFELDPMRMFLVPQGKKFGPCNCSV